MEPPSRLGERASTERDVHRVGPLVARQWRTIPRVERPVDRGGLPRPPLKGPASVPPEAPLASPLPIADDESSAMPRPLSRAPPDGAKKHCSVNRPSGHDPRASVPARRPLALPPKEELEHPMPERWSPPCHPPEGRLSPEGDWPEAAFRSPTDPPHHRWSALRQAAFFHEPKLPSDDHPVPLAPTPFVIETRPSEDGSSSASTHPTEVFLRPKPISDRVPSTTSRFGAGAPPHPTLPLSGRTLRAGIVKRLFDLALECRL